METAAIAPGTVVTVSVGCAQRIAHTGTTNESGANHIGQIALCHPHVTWQVWQKIANGFPSVREPRPSSCCLSSTSGTLGRLAAGKRYRLLKVRGQI